MKRYTTYKDSGVKWIGEIPSHWKTHRTKNIASSFSKGNGITREEVFDDGDTPCVRYGEIYTKYNESFDKCLSFTNLNIQKSPRYFHNGDILFAGTGELVEEIGKNVVYTGKEDCLAGGDIIIMSHNQDPLFLSYALNSDYAQAQKSNGKAKLKVVHISASEIGNVYLALPPLSEQRAIVYFLDTELGKIDTYMEKEQQLIDRLKELKQSVIARAVTRGINPDAKMKPSGINWIGKIPEHWQLKRLGSFFVENRKINTDLEYTEAYKFNYGSLVRKDENVDLEVVEDTYRKYTILNENDIVINGLNLNYDFVSQRVAQSYNKGIITSAYLVITPREGVNNVYFCYLLKAMDNMKLFHGMGTGIRLTLSFSDLKSQILPIPPAKEQQQIVDYITATTTKIDKLIVEKTYELEYIKELRQRIISDAVTGKIDVRE